MACVFLFIKLSMNVCFVSKKKKALRTTRIASFKLAHQTKIVQLNASAHVKSGEMVSLLQGLLCDQTAARSDPASSAGVLKTSLA